MQAALILLKKGFGYFTRLLEPHLYVGVRQKKTRETRVFDVLLMPICFVV